jgi:photosystem II stability/assembly factor-like uncharacterized protein
MKNIFIAFVIITISGSLIGTTVLAAGTWTLQNSGVTQDLYDIDFVDTLNGWCCGYYEYILHTTDGGQNWSIQHQSVSPDLNIAIDMVNADTGYVAGGHNWTSGWIYKTTDGGNIWNGTQVLPGRVIYDIFFIDTERGWAAGGNMAYDTLWNAWLWQYILKTTDGGESWDIVLADSSLNDPAQGELWGISFADSLNGVAVGYAGNIFTSNDGGQSWTRRSGVTNRQLFDVAHLKSLNFVAVGDTGLIIRTVDGGVTWDTCVRDSVAAYRAVDFTDSAYGWVVGRSVSGPPKGYTINTIDGGLNWFYKLSEIDKNLYGVKFVNHYYGWACGMAGIIYKYYDPAGVSGEPGQNSKLKREKALIYPNPFSNSINIKYNASSNEPVSVKFYNIKGELVKILIEQSNSYVLSLVWEGDDQNGSKLTNGIYFCRIQQGNYNQTIKLIKLK